MCFSLATEYHCNQERGAYADQIISPFFTKMTYMQASFWSSHRTAFTRFELQWQSAQYVKGLSSLSHELCLCALQCYCWEHGQLNLSIISPASYFYRCTSCFTNRSVYVFTARCFNSLESIYNQVQQKIWLIIIGNQIN